MLYSSRSECAADWAPGSAVEAAAPDAAVEAAAPDAAVEAGGGGAAAKGAGADIVEMPERGPQARRNNGRDRSPPCGLTRKF